MSPLSYDPRATVGGPAATLTVAGLAAGLVAGLVAPLYAMVAGGIGLVLAISFWSIKATSWQPRTIAQLGIGLLIGALLSWALVAVGVLPQGSLGHR